MALQVLKPILTERMEVEYLRMEIQEEAGAETAAFERLGAEARSKYAQRGGRDMAPKWVPKS